MVSLEGGWVFFVPHCNSRDGGQRILPIFIFRKKSRSLISSIQEIQMSNQIGKNYSQWIWAPPLHLIKGCHALSPDHNTLAECYQYIFRLSKAQLHTTNLNTTQWVNRSFRTTQVTWLCQLQPKWKKRKKIKERK